MSQETENLNWRWFVRTGDTVFDVGANIGDKAELFLRHGAHVVCVEPQPDCVAELKSRFKGNGRVSIVPLGLAEKPGTLKLSICSQAHTISTYSARWKTGRFANYKWDKVIDTPVTTLDDLISSHGAPDYCKLDVEGFEISVLKGLTWPVPLLSFEFTHEFMEDAGTCVDHLRQIGFQRFNFARGEDPQFVCAGWLEGNALLDRLGQISDSDLWGDIYAQHGDNVAGTRPAARQ